MSTITRRGDFDKLQKLKQSREKLRKAWLKEKLGKQYFRYKEKQLFKPVSDLDNKPFFSQRQVNQGNIIWR